MDESFSSAILSAALARLDANRAGHLLVAYSGGADSVALLHALAALRLAVPLIALHVDHGLCADSAHWAAVCRTQAEQLGVCFRSARVELPPERGHSLEERARAARYGWLRTQVCGGDVLLTAHHRDDQAETVLLNLVRGAGVAGLAGMAGACSFSTGRLLRPLLGVSRAALQHYVHSQGLDWIDDISNRDQAFDRNYLRHAVLPVLARRWPGLAGAVARSAAHAAEAQAVLADVGVADLAGCRTAYPASLVPAAEVVLIDALRCLSPARQRNLLRSWIRLQGLEPPPTRRLAEVLAQFIDNPRAEGGGLVAWRDGALRRFRGMIFLTAPPAHALPVPSGDWDLESALALPVLGVRIVPRPAFGQGFACDRVNGRQIQLVPRRGGERAALPGRHHHRSVKNLLRELGIPPWERDAMPLLYVDGQLAAIPGVVVFEPFAAVAATPSIRLDRERQ